MKKRTGIYGGSFNPIHLGHVSLAKALAESSLVDEMWLLVSPQNPFKANANLLDDEKRLRLTRLAVSDVPGVEVCDREFFLPRPSYMFNTLTALSREHPDREFVLVIGADNWERFPDWYRSSDILARHPRSLSRHHLSASRLRPARCAQRHHHCRHAAARHQQHRHTPPHRQRPRL